MTDRSNRPYSFDSPLLLLSMSVAFEKTWPGHSGGKNRAHCLNNWFVYSFPDFLMFEVIA